MTYASNNRNPARAGDAAGFQNHFLTGMNTKISSKRRFFANANAKLFRNAW